MNIFTTPQVSGKKLRKNNGIIQWYNRYFAASKFKKCSYKIKLSVSPDRLLYDLSDFRTKKLRKTNKDDKKTAKSPHFGKFSVFFVNEKSRHPNMECRLFLNL